MQESINIKKINKLKVYVPFDTNNSSRIYYEKNLLHKIPYSVGEELTTTLLYLDSKNIKGVIKVTNFIEENNKVIGYTMKKYKNYKSLAKLKRRNVRRKINDCQKIIRMFDKFNREDLIYSDFHTGNILLNPEDNDIKVCDLDNFRLSKEKDDKKWQIYGAMEICVAYLFNVDNVEADIVVNRSGINIDNCNYIRECLKSFGQDDFHNKVKKLSRLDTTKLIQDRKRIQEEARDFMKSGYYRFF